MPIAHEYMHMAVGGSLKMKIISMIILWPYFLLRNFLTYGIFKILLRS